MTCSRCRSIPKFDFGNCRVYLHSRVDELFLKIENIIGRKYPLESSNKNYLEFEVYDFIAFIEGLYGDDSIVKKERDDINILPLAKGELLDFSEFSNTRSLKEWMDMSF